MNKSDYRMDMSFLDDYDGTIQNYEPFDMLANRKNVPAIILCSKNPNPARWSIVSMFGSVHFLRYKDMHDYIVKNGLVRWTEEHDRKAGVHLCGIANKSPFIF